MASARTGTAHYAFTRPCGAQRGFTLTEMLIALAIFSMLSVGVAQVMASVGTRFIALNEQSQDRRLIQQAQASLNRSIKDWPGRSDPTSTPIQPDLRSTCQAQANQAGDTHGSRFVDVQSGSVIATFDRAQSCALIASASTIVNAPRQCTYDAVGRRCLQEPQQ